MSGHEQQVSEQAREDNQRSGEPSHLSKLTNSQDVTIAEYIRAQVARNDDEIERHKKAGTTIMAATKLGENVALKQLAEKFSIDWEATL